MESARRPFFMAGVAMVGASVIAITPVTAPPPDIQVRSVQLAASIDNPVDVFRPVFDEAGAVFQNFINTQAANPFPVLRQFIANQVESATILRGVGETAGQVVFNILSGLPAVLQNALEKSLAGDPATAFGDIVQGFLLPAGPLLLKMSHIYSVLQRPVAVFQELIAASFSRPQNFIIAGLTHGVPLVQQVIRSGQTIIDAVMTGNPVTILNAVQHGIADVASKAVSFAAGMADQVRVIQNVLVRAFQARPRLLPNPTPASAVAALAAAPETQAIAAGQDDSVVAAPAPDAVSGEGVATPVVDADAEPVVVDVVEAEPVVVDVVEAEPVVDVVDPDLEGTVPDAATTEVAAEADVDSAATDAATAMKDGNKAVPGVVNTGVTGSGAAVSETTEAAQSPLKSLGDQVKSALDKVASGFAKPAGSASVSQGSAGAGSADSGGGEE